MFRYSTLVATAALFLGSFGCASAVVEPTQKLSGDIPKPDVIIVHDFAVTPDEVQLDKGVAATIYRDAQGRTPDADQARAGKMVADKLSQKLVESLTKEGIPAVRAASGVQPTTTSIVLTGQFITVDQGNQSARVWIGFGLGSGELRTRGQLFQNGKLISQGETYTKASLMPGMVVGLATGSAAGTVGTSLATGAAGATFSETFLANVEADASRTATEVAKKIKSYYVERGWLPK